MQADDRRRPTIARSRLAWPLATPLLAAGLLAGHDVSYRLVVADSVARDHFLDRTGHSYLAVAPLLGALAATLVVAALAWRATTSLRGHPGATAPAWLFAALAPLAFTLQEHLERLVHDGAFPWQLALEPVFLVGLALQLPFALAALAMARVLESLTDGAIRLLARFPVAPARAPASPLRGRRLPMPRLRRLARAHAVRGPPLTT